MARRQIGKRRAGKRKKKKKDRRQASRADRHVLYQQAVQSPSADIEFFVKAFEAHRSRSPRSLREDFCGTAYLSATWVREHERNTALGVDFHYPTLAWGHHHNLRPLEPEQRGRINLLCADVLDGGRPQVDVVCAMNFSFCAFKSRETLGRYFDAVYRGLGPEGLFVCELYGGTEAIVELEEEREIDEGFTFVWEQERFNPINHETLCHIHFAFPDGSRIRRAFSYDWRLWTLPETRELLREAGFSKTEVHWEEVDEDGDGTGEHHATEEEENQEGWLVYVVAIK